jgi:hypothetical protein
LIYGFYLIFTRGQVTYFITEEFNPLIENSFIGLVGNSIELVVLELPTVIMFIKKLTETIYETTREPLSGKGHHPHDPIPILLTDGRNKTLTIHFKRKLV